MSWIVERTRVERTEVTWREKLEADLAAFQIVPVAGEYEVDLFQEVGDGLLQCFARLKGDTEAIKRALPYTPLSEQISVGEAGHYNSVSQTAAVTTFEKLEHLA